MSLDIEKIRGETLGCQEVLHFNNAGASLQPDCVHDIVIEYLEAERRIGGYAVEADYADAIEGFYRNFARLFNCKPTEIAYVENATRAWDMAFYSVPWKPGDRVLTAKSEYVSNYLAYLQVAKRHGITVDVVPDDENGQLDVDALESMIDDRVKLISVTHIPTQGGLVNPAVEIGKVARKHGVLYLLDACQSAGQLPLDVDEIGCDMLSGTGRKYMRGPRGTGMLYVRESVIETLEPVFIDLQGASWTSKTEYELRPDAKRFENNERHFAGMLGLSKAAEYAVDLGMEQIYDRIRILSDKLRSAISAINGCEVHDLGVERCGLVTFSHSQFAHGDIHKRLREKNINVSVSSVTSARLDFEDRGLTDLVRASIHYFNTEQEIDLFCEQLSSL